MLKLCDARDVAGRRFCINGLSSLMCVAYTCYCTAPVNDNITQRLIYASATGRNWAGRYIVNVGGHADGVARAFAVVGLTRLPTVLAVSDY